MIRPRMALLLVPLLAAGCSHDPPATDAGSASRAEPDRAAVAADGTAPSPSAEEEPMREPEPPLGTPPPEWTVSHWINGDAVHLADLRGKAVLVRWWTAPGCPYCTATAPALREFHEMYGPKGLVVVGFYHHKSPAPLRPDDVKEYAAELGMPFRVAIDDDWKTLKAWWLTEDRDFTSVSFLVDRHGVVRHVHPGGAYVKGDADYAAMRQAIETVLAED